MPGFRKAGPSRRRRRRSGSALSASQEPTLARITFLHNRLQQPTSDRPASPLICHAMNGLRTPHHLPRYDSAKAPDPCPRYLTWSLSPHAEPPLTPAEKKVVKSFGDWTEFMRTYGLKPTDAGDAKQAYAIVKMMAQADEHEAAEAAKQ